MYTTKRWDSCSYSDTTRSRRASCEGHDGKNQASRIDTVGQFLLMLLSTDGECRK